MNCFIGISREASSSSFESLGPQPKKKKKKKKKHEKKREKKKKKEKKKKGLAKLLGAKKYFEVLKKIPCRFQGEGVKVLRIFW